MLFKEANQKAIQKKLKMARNCGQKTIQKVMNENFFDWPLILKKSCKLFFLIPEPDYFQNEIFKK